MNTLPMPSVPELTQHIRSALAHLYDHAYLQNHPLSSYIDDGVDSDQVTRAQQLRRLLLDCIDALSPSNQADARSEATRAYAILTYRYVDGLDMDEIAATLSLSRRQVYREHAKGIDAVSSLYLARLQQHRSRMENALLPDARSARLAEAQAEVNRLRQNVQTEFISVAEVLEELVMLLAPRLDQIGARLVVEPAAAWPEVLADRTMVRQALLNVISQGLHAVPPYAEVKIKGCANREGLRLKIDAKTIAAPDVEPPLRARTGIGIAVAQRLIEAQNGQLTVRWHDNVWHAEMILPTAILPTVLVVDDNAELVTLFRRYLGGHQVAIVGATSGEQAHALALEIQPHLILLDLMLPMQDGWQIMAQLREDMRTRSIPVTICSVLDEVELAMTMGASDYITKPVSQQALLTLMRRWLGTLRLAA